MPRPLRVFLPNVSVHVIHRGNNRMAIFDETSDRDVFLSLLQRSAQRHQLSIHAYVLMTNHLHLIVTPSSMWSLPKTMQRVGLHYVRFYNAKYDRTGTLWNGRYRALLIEDERYLLTCLRYIEQNPVRARIVESAADYQWSSYSAHAFGHWPAWLTPHTVYRALGVTQEERERAYRVLCGAPLAEDQLVLSRQSTGRHRGVG